MDMDRLKEQPDQRRVDMPNLIGASSSYPDLRLGWVNALPRSAPTLPPPAAKHFVQKAFLIGVPMRKILSVIRNSAGSG